MAAKKKPTAVITPDGESLIISVPNNLKDKIKVSGKGSIDTAAIARAEAAIKELSSEFGEWMKEEIGFLMEAYENVRTHGLVEPYAEKLYLTAHDLRGQAETLGFPLIGEYCASMCKMFDAVTKFDKIPLHAIESHIGAISVALRDDIRTNENKVANAVLEKLTIEVDDFYNHHKQLEADRLKNYVNPVAEKKPKVNIDELAKSVGAVIVGKTKQIA